MSMVGFPLLLIPLAIYNIIVFLMPDVSFADPLFKLMLISGVEWPVTLSDILLALGVVLLLSEVIKGARPGAKYLTDHVLSLIIFGAAAAEFLLWPKFASSTYFLLVLLAMADFLSGIALRARRVVAAASTTAVSGHAARKTETSVSEPRLEPAPAPAPAPTRAPAPAPAPAPEPSVPSATSVAESVLLDHPEPKPAQPAVASHPASPEVSSPEVSSPEVASPKVSSSEVSSPELQPGNGSHPSPGEPQR